MAGKYSESQAMRFRLVGARTFLRFSGPDLDDRLLFGDCGAFSYAQQEEPPYRPEEMAEFYEDSGFTHGFPLITLFLISSRKQRAFGMDSMKDRLVETNVIVAINSP